MMLAKDKFIELVVAHMYPNKGPAKTDGTAVLLDDAKFRSYVQQLAQQLGIEKEILDYWKTKPYGPEGLMID